MSLDTPTTPTPVVSTVDEAAAALATFQDIMAREASRNGHSAEFRTWIERAIEQIPGLREAGEAKPLIPTGTLSVSVRFTTLPGVTEDDWRSGRDQIKNKSQEFMRTWARENGYPDGQFNSEQQVIAYVLHHPEQADLGNDYTTGYVDAYSITNYRNSGDGTRDTGRRVEFVR